MNNWRICWLFAHILLWILIFKGITARRLYKSFGVKGLRHIYCSIYVSIFPPFHVCIDMYCKTASSTAVVNYYTNTVKMRGLLMILISYKAG
jgi:hypothetical protein